ncbi:hypothetical protein [Foetidibacter luteolus]|uniref:hypothetical protein n=1 Tax=Foetidibacter luteolus TaxID=2608880 RepID=UPI00129AB018|nr:hypothetical protein [Foetidibacter luteolus]
MKPIRNIIPFLMIAAIFSAAWVLSPRQNQAGGRHSQNQQQASQKKDSNTNTPGGGSLFNESFFRINTTLR